MSYTEHQLKTMLLSSQEKERETALKFIYLSKEWRAIAKSILVHCSDEFVEASNKQIIVYLAKDAQTELPKKELIAYYKDRCTRYYDDILVDMFQQGGPARTEAMKLCFKRFYNKIFNILKK